MEQWVKIPPEWNNHAIVIHNFSALDVDYLDLTVGDYVILEQQYGESWLFGKIEGSDKRGLFPYNYVRLVQPDVSYPRVSETLREWVDAIKKRFVTGNDSQVFLEMCKCVDKLAQEKLNLDSGIRAENQIRECKEYVARLIDKGNMDLGLDMRLRADDFSPINPLAFHSATLYHKHKDISNNTRHNQGPAFKDTCSVMIDFINLEVDQSTFCDSTEFVVAFGLFSSNSGSQVFRHFSETALVKGTLDKFRRQRQQIIFTDLTSKTIETEKIILAIQLMRIGAMDTKRNSQNQQKDLKRPVAVGRIQDFFRTNIHQQNPLTLTLTQTSEQFLETVLQSFKSDAPVSSDFKMRLSINVVNLSHSAIAEDPAYSQCIVSRRLTIHNDLKNMHPRNNIYVNLVGADLQERWDMKSLHGSRERNIEAKVMLVASDGTLLPIHPGGASDPAAEPTTTYKSTVYYHKNGPRWGEMIKIDIPKDCRSAHLRFHFFSRASERNKLHAMAFLPLCQGDDGSMLRNGIHHLHIYKVNDTKKYSEANREYLSLRWKEDAQNSRSATLPYLTLCSRDRMIVEVILSSTNYTNNENVNGILKWESHAAKLNSFLISLAAMLFSDSDAIEIFKFFPKLFDVFFNILCNEHNIDSRSQVLRTMLRILSHAQQKNDPEHFTLIINRYLDHFRKEEAHKHLINFMNLRLQEYNRERGSVTKELVSDLCSILKCSEILFKFVVRSKIAAFMHNSQREKDQFQENLVTFFNHVKALMQTQHIGPHSQELFVLLEALKVFPKIVSILIHHMPIPFLVERSIEMLKVKESGSLLYKLQMMIGLTNGVHFEQRDFRIGVLQALIGEVRGVFLQCTRDIYCATKQSCQQLDSCNSALEVLDNILRQLEQTVEKKQSVDESVQILINVDTGILRPLMQLCYILEVIMSNDAVMENSKMRSTASACVMSIFQLMDRDRHWQLIIKSYQQEPSPLANDEIAVRMSLLDLEDFTCELLDLIKSLCNFNVYKLCASGSTWMDMLLLQGRTCMNLLRIIVDLILPYFRFPSVNRHVINRFFDAISAFVRQDSLQWKSLTVWQKAYRRDRHLHQIDGKDWRIEAVNLMLNVWDELGSQQSSFIPERVDPLLEMSFVRKKHIRTLAISMIFDLMSIGEENNANGTLTRRGSVMEVLCPKVSESLISSLDHRRESITAEYKAQFETIMTSKFQGNQLFNTDRGRRLLDSFLQQMKLLIEYTTFIHDENAENRKMAIFNLLTFYRSINREMMYVRYLDKLTKMNIKSNDFTEAANTLLLITKQINWSNELLGDTSWRREFPMYPGCSTQASLKERLYMDIIEHFVKDGLYEKALEHSEELLRYYKEDKVDYKMTAKIHGKMAGYYEKLNNEDRTAKNPSYYAVYFYGDGLPSFIADRPSFIYRGRFGKMLPEMMEMLQTQFPNAQRLGEPERPKATDNCQYYRILKVKSVDKPPADWSNKDIPEKIMWYYRHNGSKEFVHETRMKIPGSDNSITNLWIERTTLRTKEELPSVLRMVPIEYEESVKKNPLENAIASVKERTESIRDLISSNPITNYIHSIENVVQGIVMPFVSGGYELYAPFYTDGRAEDWFTPNLLNSLNQSIQQNLEMVQRAMSVLDQHSTNAALLLEMKKHLSDKLEYVRTEFGIEVPLKIDIRGNAKAAHSRRDTKRYQKRPTMVPPSTQRDSFTEGSNPSPFGSNSTLHDSTSLEDRSSASTLSEQGSATLLPSPVPPPRPLTFVSSSTSYSETPPPTPLRASVFTSPGPHRPPPPPPPPHSQNWTAEEPPQLPPRASHLSP